MPPGAHMLCFQSDYNHLFFFVLLLSGNAVAAADRIVTPVDPLQTVVLKGQIDPRAQAQYDLGPVDPSTPLGYVTLLLKPADGLGTFLQDQQNPASANYHRWLTPEQFADRFGLTRGDIAKLTAWLESQGLKVNDIARGRHWITFSGSADQVSRAFQTEIHRYLVNGASHFANSTALSIPAAFANVVSAVSGLNDFRLQSMALQAMPVPALTGGNSHFLTPDDLATIYDITPLYNAGFTGAGQKLAIVGQMALAVSDVQAFRAAFNLPPNDPQVIVYGLPPGYYLLPGVESALDVEWSGAVARDAAILYVYSPDVLTAAQYAVDQNLAPVMTMSYGACELYATPGYESVAQQANAQGITWMISSGDWGAATCDYTSPTPQAAKGLTVSFPASVPEVTAVGGTEFDEGSGSYWSSTNTANGASALSWIPEMAWNDSLERSGLAATGGGASAFYTKPFWQSGPGVPNDNARDLPDVAFAASPDHDGYEVYTGGTFQVYGGTSFASPVFAGMVALLNQYVAAQGSSAQPGLGNINPTLYRLAQATSDVFHDVTIGSNIVPCVQDSPDCSNGQLGYAAGPGYDQATGLGSVDAWHLVTEWGRGAAATATTTTLIANPASYVVGDTVQLTATVTAAGAQTAPTGTVTFLANNNPIGTAALASSGRTATAAISVPAALVAAGNGTVTAFYGGDAAFSASAGTAATTLQLPASGSLVVPSVTPYPVVQQGTGSNAVWVFSATLTEKAGVATTLTAFTIDGADVGLLGFDTYIAPYGTVYSGTTYLDVNYPPPGNHIFHFEGVDMASGQTWSQNLTVPFVLPTGPAPPGLAPSVALTSIPATVSQDLTQDPSCQWSHELILQEQAGFEVDLAQLSWSTGDFAADGIQQLFGTTQLAPYGMLRATICRGNATGTDFYMLGGFAETGDFVTPYVSVTFTGPAMNPAAFSVSPSAVNLSAPDTAHPASATVSLEFSGGAPRWTAQVLPVNRTSSWLAVSPLFGSGPAQLQLTAAAGLSKGVYNAIIAIEPSGAAPQSITVPVTFVVGASNALSVDHASNAASYSNGYAPGMIMSVLGSELAPAPQQADVLPLPLTMQGVSATVNGVAAPLYYVSPTQLNIQVPYETTLGPAVLGISNNGNVTSFSFPVTIAAPGIFAEADGSLVPSSTGQQGQMLAAYLTGAGDNTPPLVTGTAPPPPPPDTPLSILPQPILPVTLTVGGLPATLSFVGSPTWAVGITQINFTIPANAPLGPQPVVVTVGGVASSPVTVNVTAATAAP